jgi:hypothetical protein
MMAPIPGNDQPYEVAMNHRLLSKLSWIEVRILNYLNDQGGPVSFRYVRTHLIPDKKITITNTLFDLQRDGLVEIHGEPQIIDITPEGRNVLFHALTDKDC